MNRPANWIAPRLLWKGSRRSNADECQAAQEFGKPHCCFCLTTHAFYPTHVSIATCFGSYHPSSEEMKTACGVVFSYICSDTWTLTEHEFGRLAAALAVLVPQQSKMKMPTSGTRFYLVGSAIELNDNTLLLTRDQRGNKGAPSTTAGWRHSPTVILGLSWKCIQYHWATWTIERIVI